MYSSPTAQASIASGSPPKENNSPSFIICQLLYPPAKSSERTAFACRLHKDRSATNTRGSAPSSSRGREYGAFRRSSPRRTGSLPGPALRPPAGSDFRFSQTCTEPQTITQSEKREPFLGRTPAAGLLFFPGRHDRIKDHRVGSAFPVICFSVGFCFFLSDAFSFRAGSDRRGGIDKGMPRCYNNIRKETRITGNKRRPEKEFFLS